MLKKISNRFDEITFTTSFGCHHRFHYQVTWPSGAMAPGLSKRKATALLFWGAPIILFLDIIYNIEKKYDLVGDVSRTIHMHVPKAASHCLFPSAMRGGWQHRSRDSIALLAHISVL